MSREVVLFKSEEGTTRSEAAKTLRLLADKIESGSVRLGNRSDSVELDIPERVVLEVKVEEETKRRTKRSIEVEVEWTVGEEGDAGGLTIG